MTRCQRCGHENPDGVDFCESCNRYLRWEPTGFMPAIVPAVPARSTQAPPGTPSTPSPTAGDEPAGQPPSTAGADEPSVSITLRHPDDNDLPESPLSVGVAPGGRVRVLALIRNQSKVTDTYELRLGALPADWLTITPQRVYLNPFGSAGGVYEQEVEIELHPPRTSDAKADTWKLELAAESTAQQRVVATAPLVLDILPFQQFEATATPQRRSGRRRAKYEVTVRNRANTMVHVALDAADSDGLCRVRFGQRTVEIEPGASAKTSLEVRPPRQLWIGRPLERRLEVHTATGDDGERLLAEADARAEARRRLPRWPKKAPPVSGPRLTKPDASIGPDGIDLRGPKLSGPQVGSVNVPAPRFSLSQLKVPGGHAAPAPAPPLLPSQLVFRQRPWLPWWLAVAVPMLLALALVIYMLTPQTAAVPVLKGLPSKFAAQQKLEEAGLKLDPAGEPVVRPSVKPGTVLNQSVPAGKTVDKGSSVAIVVAIGTGSVAVPALKGKTLAEAEKLLRTAGLVIGSTSVSPPELRAKIASTIPAEKELVKQGTAIDLYYGEDGAQGGGAGGSGGEKTIAIPAIEPKDAAGYSAKLADAGLVPQAVQQFNVAKKGTVFATEPAVGEKLAKGDPVKVLISAGFPQLVYDDDKNILRIDGASGKRLADVAKSDQPEKDPTWSPDGTQVAYVADGRVMLADLSKPDAAPLALTPEGEQYADPSFAPTTDRQVLAVSKIQSGGGNDRDLCVGQITADGLRPSCIIEKGFGVADAKWAPDGKTILVPAVSPSKGFGIVRYSSSDAFSPNQSDWHGGKFVTPTDTQGLTGVRDIAIAPDGKRVAMAANINTPQFRLYLTDMSDLKLEQAKPLPVQACKVLWRPDGKEVVVVQAGALCDQPTGQLLRLAVDKTTEAVPLSASGDNPAFQPLVSGG